MMGSIEIITKDQYHLDNVISAIDNLKKEHWFKVTSNAQIINGLQARLWWKNGHFQVEIATMQLFNETLIQRLLLDKTIWFKFDNIAHKFEAKYHSFSSFEAVTSLQGYTVFKGVLKELSTSSINPALQANYTSCIPCSNRKFYIGSYFDAMMLEVGDTKYSSRILELTVADIQLQLYLYGRRNVDEQIFFVECITPTTLDKFNSVLHELILVLSYITGKFPGEEVFIWNNIFAHLGREIITTFIYPEKLKSTQFGVIPKLNDGIEEHSSLQFDLGLQTLKNMVEMCLNNASYRRTILLMINASDQPDYIFTVSYAVALESMAKLVYEDNKSKMKPIPDKKLFNELKAKLKTIVEEFKVRIANDEGIKKLHNSLDNLNKPSNTDMLTRPFAFYNIPLAHEDVDAINKRNDFLHGRLPHDTGSHELAIIGYRLQFCVNSLIMKYCAYQGAIIYPATLYQNHHNLAINMDAYRMI